MDLNLEHSLVGMELSYRPDPTMFAQCAAEEVTKYRSLAWRIHFTQILWDHGFTRYTRVMSNDVFILFIIHIIFI